MNSLVQFWAAIRRQPIVSTGCALAIALCGLNYFLYRQRAETTASHEEVRRRGETMLAFLADRTRIAADLSALRAALQSIDDHVVREESKEVNLGYFYRLEKATHVRLNRIDQMVSEPATAGAAYRAVPVTLSLNGSYRNLLTFIREVETGPRVMRVSHYQLERLADSGDELGLGLTLEMLAQP